MARKPPDQVICLRCSQAIFGPELKHLVRLSHGPMHAACHREQTAQIQQMLDEAIAAGTHALTGGPFQNGQLQPPG